MWGEGEEDYCGWNVESFVTQQACLVKKACPVIEDHQDQRILNKGEKTTVRSKTKSKIVACKTLVIFA